MSTVDDLAYYRAKAYECITQAESSRDARDAKLHRAFAKQFEQRARTLEEEDCRTRRGVAR